MVLWVAALCSGSMFQSF